MNKKRKSGKGVSKTPYRTVTKKQKIKDLLIVGIGASAGGLDAFRRLIKRLPDDTGMTFVLVQHLDPSHESSLTKIISAATKLAVIEAGDGMVMEPNCIYVMPSNADMSLSGDTIRLTGRSDTVPHLPIDSFFNSLAQEHRANAIGVILSGTASDGTIGLKRIKSEGGITFAQDQVSAKYPGMPRSAAHVGGADFVLPPEKIAAHLTKIAKQRGNARPVIKSASKPAEPDFSEILDILQQSTGVDFSNYRTTTIERRIRRRMLLNNQEKISDYVAYLRKNKSEIDLLYKDIFIHVTNFFRNPEKFETLRSKVLPALLGHRPEEPWRIWVAGCSSGEEVYSLAIVILEFLASRRAHGRLQIFATDISESEIQKARAGVYSKDIEKDVSAKHLKKFFDKIDGNYKITKSIRELCVFAKHDLTKDPPFSRMDLISCSNVLIYLEPAMQQKVLNTFHVSLKPSGFLLLGKSESTGRSSHLFELVDKKSRVYSKRMAPKLRLPLPVGKRSRTALRKSKEPDLPFDWQKEADRIVLTRYKHAGFLVDDSMKILAFRGMVTPFLEPVAGEASLELTKMVRKDLRSDLRALVQNARKTMKPVRKDNIPIRFNGEERIVIAETIPIRDPDSKQSVFLLTLEETRPTEVQSQKIPGGGKEGETAKDRLIDNLNNQLVQINEDTRVSIEQLERLNEELTSTNEELQSAMEELQSTNEEYESAKEQLESANEELVTLNEELQTSNTELDHLNLELVETRDYAQAIIRTVREPLVILDSSLRISSANDAFYRTFNISPREAEHAYFFDIKDRQWDVPVLRSKIASILKNESVLEDVEIEQDFPHLGYRVMCLNVRHVVQRKRKGEVLILLAIEDITARRQQENTSSTLMKEIHHRVKNNLMVVTSLLDLQSGVLKDKEAVEAFKDSRDRVKSMALIHEKMYESTQIGKVSFRDYLTELMNHMFKLYVKDSTKVELDLNVEDVYLDMDQAVPCGLIANELLSNALKYAFPKNRPGKIDIQVLSRSLRGKNQPPREFVLTVKDNGVGLPAGIDLKNPQSMGMKIVVALTRQLAGKLEVIREEGTLFRITFPAPKAS
jgi:two-component system, chemotaxis family, CheB/CheR fusion protein